MTSIIRLRHPNTDQKYETGPFFKLVIRSTNHVPGIVMPTKPLEKKL